MPHDHKFDVARLERLDDEARFADLDPEVMWDALGRPVPRTIVDVGAGTGLFARRFARFAPSAIVYAADTAPEMIAWMTAHADPDLAGRVRPVLAEETHVPLPDGVADLVAMISLHHELDDPAASYTEMLRLLAPGGCILVVDWAPGGSTAGPPPEIRASAAQIQESVRAAGFDDVTAHPGLPKFSLITARKPV
jgi:SAM-dependent methyltransferase